jgi:hypothetical protein
VTRRANPLWTVATAVAFVASCSSPTKGQAVPAHLPEFGPLPELCHLVPQSMVTEMLYANITEFKLHEDEEGAEFRSCRWAGAFRDPAGVVQLPELVVEFKRSYRHPKMARFHDKTATYTAAGVFDMFHSTKDGRWRRTKIPNTKRAMSMNSEQFFWVAFLIRNVTVEMRHSDKTVSREVVEQRLTKLATHIAEQLLKTG